MASNDYKDLREKHDVPRRYRELMKRMQSLLESGGFAPKAVINEDLLGKVILDYFEDVDRLKEFNEIEKICPAKICAYETYWLLRWKPIQIQSEETSAQLLYINEIICAIMMMSKMSQEAGTKLKEGDPEVKRFFNLLLYNMKYREFTQKTLELAIESFLFGCHAMSK